MPGSNRDVRMKLRRGTGIDSHSTHPAALEVLTMVLKMRGSHLKSLKRWWMKQLGRRESLPRIAVPRRLFMDDLNAGVKAIEHGLFGRAMCGVDDEEACFSRGDGIGYSKWIG